MTAAAPGPKLWKFNDLKRLFSRAYTDFNDDQAPRLGAALASAAAPAIKMKFFIFLLLRSYSNRGHNERER